MVGSTSFQTRLTCSHVPLRFHLAFAPMRLTAHASTRAMSCLHISRKSPLLSRATTAARPLES